MRQKMITTENKKEYHQALIAKGIEYEGVFQKPASTLFCQATLLKAVCLNTLLGLMLAVSDDDALYMLAFVDRQNVNHEVSRLRQKTNSTIISGTTLPIRSIEKELARYFEGKLNEFKTPLSLLGTPFQKQVWDELQKIPYGETRSYSDIAKNIGKRSAFRAVAKANGANQISIVIPCHRVINANGDWGGYDGGLTRKKWLISHEKTNLK